MKTKTNLQELLYRFKKELLNNYGYKAYICLHQKVNSGDLQSNFSYDAWAKGLYKDDLDNFQGFIEGLGILDYEYDIWDEDYMRGGGSEIDYLNMSEIVSTWINNYYVQLEFRHPSITRYLFAMCMNILFHEDFCS